MEILADSELKKLIAAGSLGLEPIGEVLPIQPASIDLRLGRVYRHKKLPGVVSIEDLDKYSEDHFLEEDTDPDLVMQRGCSKIFETTESVCLPAGYFGRVFQRSRFGRILVEASAFGQKDDANEALIFPGGRGPIRYSVMPYTDVRMSRGERICQLVVFSDVIGGTTPTKAIEDGCFEASKNTMICSDCNEIALFVEDVYIPKPGIVLSPSEHVDLGRDFEKVNRKVLPPGRVYLGVGRESFRFSDHVAGIIDRSPCSSLAEHHPHMASCFAGFVDPGYEGGITLQLYSHWGPIDTTKPVATLRLYKIKGAVERPYGSSSLGSSHQGNFKAG